MHLAAAAQFFEREGHLLLSRKHVETITVGGNGDEDQAQRDMPLKLGAGGGNQRPRAASLNPERVEQLSEVEMRWT
ncbi:hypothetical protein [Streptomyces tubercidicus]|uniref:hypothetical protein n=1 Tax=Streptomyces tubercidicus TaxID=47759 RepID=UPI003F5BFE0C